MNPATGCILDMIIFTDRAAWNSGQRRQPDEMKLKIVLLKKQETGRYPMETPSPLADYKHPKVRREITNGVTAPLFGFNGGVTDISQEN